MFDQVSKSSVAIHTMLIAFRNLRIDPRIFFVLSVEAMRQELLKGMLE